MGWIRGKQSCGGEREKIERRKEGREVGGVDVGPISSKVNGATHSVWRATENLGLRRKQECTKAQFPTFRGGTNDPQTEHLHHVGEHQLESLLGGKFASLSWNVGITLARGGR